MTAPKRAGIEGEMVAEWSLVRQRWTITGRQVEVHGHLLDLTATHPLTGEEWLVEVKVWRPGTGVDTIKKAIADAHDLAEAGEERPYLLMLSKPMTGLYAQMITRARRAGVINDVQLIGATPHEPDDSWPVRRQEDDTPYHWIGDGS